METSQKVPSLEKKILAAALIFTAAQLGLIAYAAIRLGISVPDCVTNVKPFDAGQFIKVAPDRYEVHVVARMWMFQPGVIRVPAGSTVDFYLTSADVAHGFYIENTNVNLMALPSVVNYAQARFKAPGIYPIVCHEFCGSAHHLMSGVVEVTEPGTEGSAEGLE